MNILFLCVANSARSQLAEGLARSLCGEEHSIQSAGSFHAYVHPMAIEVMGEIDIDITTQTSKPASSIEEKSVDLVITLCEEEVCPVFLDKAKKLHWPMPDPTRGETEAERRVKFRVIRDQIKDKLIELKTELSL